MGSSFGRTAKGVYESEDGEDGWRIDIAIIVPEVEPEDTGRASETKDAQRFKVFAHVREAVRRECGRE